MRKDRKRSVHDTTEKKIPLVLLIPGSMLINRTVTKNPKAISTAILESPSAIKDGRPIMTAVSISKVIKEGKDIEQIMPMIHKLESSFFFEEFQNPSGIALVTGPKSSSTTVGKLCRITREIKDEKVQSYKKYKLEILSVT
jgi:hypothetical protein